MTIPRKKHALTSSIKMRQRLREMLRKLEEQQAEIDSAVAKLVQARANLARKLDKSMGDEDSVIVGKRKGTRGGAYTDFRSPSGKRIRILDERVSEEAKSRASKVIRGSTNGQSTAIR